MRTSKIIRVSATCADHRKNGITMSFLGSPREIETLVFFAAELERSCGAKQIAHFASNGKELWPIVWRCFFSRRPDKGVITKAVEDGGEQAWGEVPDAAKVEETMLANFEWATKQFPGRSGPSGVCGGTYDTWAGRWVPILEITTHEPTKGPEDW